MQSGGIASATGQPQQQQQLPPPPPPRRESEDDAWVRFFKSPPWYVLVILGPIISILIGYLARDVLIQATTAVFLGVAALTWLVAYGFVKVYVHDPIRLMTTARANGTCLNDDLARVKNDLTAEIGGIVIRRAITGAKDQPLFVQEANAVTDRAYVPVNLREFRMDEETLGDIEVLIDTIDLVEVLRGTVSRARSYLSATAIFLLLWLPAIIIAAVFIAGLPQDLTTASLVLAFEILVVWALWFGRWGPETREFRRWASRIAGLHDATYEELKNKVKMMYIMEE